MKVEIPYCRGFPCEGLYVGHARCDWVGRQEDTPAQNVLMP
jgi:hypothetical protein